MNVRSIALVLLCLVLWPTFGCSGAEDTNVVPPPDETSEVRVEAGPYELAPGEERRYQCFAVALPESVSVVRIDPIYGPGVHHIVAWLPAVNGPDGPFDCPELANPTWLPLYVAGIGSGPLVMPDGSAMKLAAGQQVIVQLHLLNGTPDPMGGSAGVTLTTTAKKGLTAAGAWGADNHQIAIPPQSTGVVAEQTCTVGQPMDVFAAFGHAHMLGKRVQVFRGGEPLFDEPWNFDDQPVIPVSFHLDPGEQITIRCTYDNPTSAMVTYGESSSEEMCSFVAYYTPWPGFQGCVQQ